MSCAKNMTAAISFFVDEAITPRILRQLSDGAGGERPAEINWTGAARFEKALSDDILAGIGRGRLPHAALWPGERLGADHGRPWIKGTQARRYGAHSAHRQPAGIWNHTFFFFGFPGETIENAQETVNFIYAHQDVIHSASPGAFLLERYSPAYRDPAAFGVRT